MSPGTTAQGDPMYDAHIKTNGGNPGELSLAAIVADEILNHYRPDGADVFLGDHTHEGLSPGSCSVAWEGGPYNWTVHWAASEQGHAIAKAHGVIFEPMNGCILAVCREA